MTGFVEEHVHQCDIRGCPGVAEWFIVGNGREIQVCRDHRDLIEDHPLDLIHPDD